MPIVVVETMSEQPGTCIGCGSSGFVDGEVQQPIIEIQGVDINWGETPYLCAECVGMICDLTGRVNQEDHDEVLAERDQLSTQLKDLGEEHQTLNERVSRMLDGARARKEQKEVASV